MGSNPILSATFGLFVVRIRTDSVTGYEKGPNRTQEVTRRAAAVAGGRGQRQMWSVPEHRESVPEHRENGPCRGAIRAPQGGDTNYCNLRRNVFRPMPQRRAGFMVNEG